MKRLLCLLLCLSFILLTGCAGILPTTPEETARQKTDEETNAGTEPESNATTEPVIDIPPAPFFRLEDELINALILQRKYPFVEVDLPAVSFADKLDFIKNGQRTALYTDFENSSHYYACAYSDSDHEQEAKVNCCIDDYTWIGVNDEKDIPETYRNKTFMFSYQVNRASVCKNIVSGSTDIKIEHYISYTPDFNDGKNTAPALNPEICFIYLAYNPTPTIYLGDAIYRYPSSVESFSCTKSNDQIYIKQFLSQTREEGIIPEPSEERLRQQFGTYYDDLMSIMITGQVIETSDDGWISSYGLFRIEDIVSLLSSEEG